MDIGLTDQASAGHVSAGRSLFRGHMRRFAQWSRRHPRLTWVMAAAVVCLVLFWCYLRQAQTYQLNADPAGQALQAWDMLHGNLLLRGWWLGDVSFYTVELPLNMIIELGDGFDFTGADFAGWCREVGFKATNAIPLAGPTSAGIAYK